MPDSCKIYQIEVAARQKQQGLEVYISQIKQLA